MSRSLVFRKSLWLFVWDVWDAVTKVFSAAGLVCANFVDMSVYYYCTVIANFKNVQLISISPRRMHLFSSFVTSRPGTNISHCTSLYVKTFCQRECEFFFRVTSYCEASNLLPKLVAGKHEVLYCLVVWYQGQEIAIFAQKKEMCLWLQNCTTVRPVPGQWL